LARISASFHVRPLCSGLSGLALTAAGADTYDGSCRLPWRMSHPNAGTPDSGPDKSARDGRPFMSISCASSGLCGTLRSVDGAPSKLATAAKRAFSIGRARSLPLVDVEASATCHFICDTWRRGSRSPDRRGQPKSRVAQPVAIPDWPLGLRPRCRRWRRLRHCLTCRLRCR
jgi:hypothetical protein